jgi:hypothetical protein
VVEFIEEALRPPEEEEEEVEGPDGAVLTSTQKSKLKKKELKAAEGAKTETSVQTSTVARTDRDKSIEPVWDEVAKLCESFDMLRAVHEINVSKPENDEVDPALWNCHWLKLLKLKLGSNFEDIPGEKLVKLTELQQLILSGNSNLKSLPPQVGSLQRLRNLELEGCGLTSLPESIGQLSGLESINISNNRLTSLQLDGCTSLSLLNLSGNKLTALTLPFSQLTRLSELRCSRNQITVLPSELSLLVSLTIFEAEENKIREVPIEVTQLKKVKAFKLGGNPIADPKIAKLVKDGKGPKDLFSKLGKVEERNAGKKKEKGSKSKGKQKAESDGDEEDVTKNDANESSDLDIDDDEL